MPYAPTLTPTDKPSVIPKSVPIKQFIHVYGEYEYHLTLEERSWNDHNLAASLWGEIGFIAENVINNVNGIFWLGGICTSLSNPNDWSRMSWSGAFFSSLF